MRQWRNFQTRCHHLASRVANRAFYFGGVKAGETLRIASSNDSTARYVTPRKDAGLVEPVDASLHSPRQSYKLAPRVERHLRDSTPPLLLHQWGQSLSSLGGLLAMSMDGIFYIPCYDHNGNIVLYVSETGATAAQYTYDPYGNITESSGPLADVFSFGFSTKYHDRETGMIGYKRRFYRPDLGRWLNRDPIEEAGGENLYVFCLNKPIVGIDINGELFWVDTLVASAIGGIIGGVSAALTGGDIKAGIVGGTVSGFCMSMCPWAPVECGALGGAVSGLVTGINSARKKNLCGAKWRVHVAGSVLIGTATGAIFGKLGDKIDPIIGTWKRTVTASSLTINIEVSGADVVTSFSAGVSSTAAELMFLTLPEEVKDATRRLGDKMSEEYKKINLELEAHGQFK